MSETFAVRNLGSEPVSAAKPAGSNPRDGSTFEALQSQIDRLTDIHAGQAVEWPKVAELAGIVLKDEGKDLAAGTWLALALFNLRGLDGLCDGICVLRGLVGTYWEDMSPPAKRIRGRRNQMQWLLDQLTAALDEQALMQMPPMGAPQHAAMLDDWNALDAAWQQHDDDAPAFYGLAAVLQRLPVQEEQTPEPPASDAASAQPAAGQPAAANPGAASAQPGIRTAAPSTGAPPTATMLAAPDSGADAATVVDGALATLHPIVDWLIQEQPASPLLFRLNRICAWTTLDQAPAAQGRTTLLPAPPGQLVDSFQHIVQSGEPQAVVAFAESRLAGFPCWLDLSRASHGALTQMGAGPAAEVVAGQTAHLLSRVPGLADLAFNDGMPFADAATQGWLKALAAAGAESGVAPQPDDEVDALAGQAESQAVAGKLDDALAQLQQAVLRAPARRTGFRLRLAQCALLHRFDAKTDMRAMIAPLVNELEARELPEWEPELARRALELAAGIEQRHGGAPAAPVTPMLERLSRVDVPAAWHLSQSTAS